MAKQEGSPVGIDSTRVANGTIFEQAPSINLEKMTERQLYSYICGPILNAENAKYKNGNTAYHKLIFLYGGDKNDISECLDLEGKPIYTNRPDYIKYTEITEFNAAVLNYGEFPKKERETKKEIFETLKVKVISEIADIFHNLITLTKLDGENKRIYYACIKRLAFTLGYSVQECLLLSAMKYKKRLIDIGDKDPDQEEEVIRKITTPDSSGETLLAFPGGQRLRTTAKTINEIGKVSISKRLAELEMFHKWNGSSDNGI